MPKVTISLITFNSERYLPHFIDSLKSQSFTDYELMAIDNASTDRSVAEIKEQLPSAHISVQPRNLGYARPHNLIIQWSDSPYVLVTNDDIIFHPHCLEQMVRAMDRHPEVGSVSAKLLQWNSDEGPEKIDTLGLSLDSWYRLRDTDQGLPDYEVAERTIFGPSGAFALYRREALEAVKISVPAPKAREEFFDEDFFMYKEDGDLAWRLQSAGWKSLLVPTAIAFHRRSITANRGSFRDRRGRGAINRLSYRNHFWMIYKNHYWPYTLRHILGIAAFEIAKFIFLLTTGGASLRGGYEAVRGLPRMRIKRKQIIGKRVISAKQFARSIE